MRTAKFYEKYIFPQNNKMCSVFSYKSPSEEEAVLVHVDSASCLQYFHTHMEAEE